MILFNKPYGVLTQFSAEGEHRTLADFITAPGFYPAGRLDADSEGLVVLTNDGRLQAHISDPRFKMAKTYWVQVEGVPDDLALEQLRRGVDLGDFVTAPSQVARMEEPSGLWQRTPAVRYRASIPTSWLKLSLKEGKNRQVRRMTARVGYPTLRLVRWAIGDWTLADLPPGCWRESMFDLPLSAARPRRHSRTSKQGGRLTRDVNKGSV